MGNITIQDVKTTFGLEQDPQEEELTKLCAICHHINTFNESASADGASFRAEWNSEVGGIIVVESGGEIVNAFFVLEPNPKSNNALEFLCVQDISKDVLDQLYEKPGTIVWSRDLRPSFGAQ